jgi:hypothetical protein
MPVGVWTPLLRLHQYVLNSVLFYLYVFFNPKLRTHRLLHIQYFFIFEVSNGGILLLPRSLSAGPHLRKIVPGLRRELRQLRLFGTSTLSFLLLGLVKRVHKLGVVQHLHVHLVILYAVRGLLIFRINLLAFAVGLRLNVLL